MTGPTSSFFPLGIQPPEQLPAFYGSSLWLNDGLGMRYRFQIYDIRQRNFGYDVVYAFARLNTITQEILYVGKADDLDKRIGSHEKLPEALRRGADYLLVHRPGLLDRVSYLDAERRLIAKYSPPLNKQHNPLWELVEALSG